MRGAVAKNIDDYLKGVKEPYRELLLKLRQQIREAAPDAVETIAYQMPAFKLDGRPLAYFAAFAKHASYFPVGAAVVDNMPETRPWRTSKGTLQFTAERPIPAKIIKKIVKARAAQIRG